MAIYHNAAADFAQEWAVDVNEEIGSEIANLKIIHVSSFAPKCVGPLELLQNIFFFHIFRSVSQAETDPVNIFTIESSPLHWIQLLNIN